MADDFRNGIGAPLPQRRQHPVYPLWWTKPGAPPLDLSLIGTTWEAYWVHWVPSTDGDTPGRDVLCIDEGGPCPYCHFKLKWVGYIQCYNHLAKQVGITVLTPAAALDLQGLMCQYEGVRGRRVLISRDGTGSKGAVHVQPSREGVYAKITEMFSMQETLKVLWRLKVWPCDLVIPMERRDTIPFPTDDDSGRYGLGEQRGGIR